MYHHVYCIERVRKAAGVSHVAYEVPHPRGVLPEGGVVLHLKLLKFVAAKDD
jgi:hypothetical protein